MRMIPGVVVLAPQSPDEIRGAAKAMLAHEGPVYMLSLIHISTATPRRWTFRTV